MKAISIDFARIQKNFPKHERGIELARSVIEQVAGAEIKSLRPETAEDAEYCVEQVEMACPRWHYVAGEHLSAFAGEHPALCAAAKRWLNPSLIRAWAFEIAEKQAETK